MSNTSGNSATTPMRKFKVEVCGHTIYVDTLKDRAALFAVIGAGEKPLHAVVPRRA